MSLRPADTPDDPPRADQPVVFDAPPSVDTPTSPNTNVVTTPRNDLNSTVDLSFQYQGRIPVWTPLVSVTITPVRLGETQKRGKAMWLKGMKVFFNALNAQQYTITLDGTIVDDDARYPQNNTVLGIFQVPPAVRVARALQMRSARDGADLPQASFLRQPRVDALISPHSHVTLTPTAFDSAPDPRAPFIVTAHHAGGAMLWRAELSAERPVVTLADDRCVGRVCWRRDLSITLRRGDDGLWTIALSGVVDDGDETIHHDATALHVMADPR
ncbi:MAG: hypothetical protein AAF772_17955 [Acidobacteriota bacterium]